ncbi:MAG TPA: response regulator [Bryobacteraceae bacterium]|nr:response regulator [Bryobacteraceae bacterium]
MTTEGGPPARRRILIVDDAEEARGVLAIALQTVGGATVETTDNAEDALRRMTNERVDVLVTDVRMRGMSGLDLLSRLRESGCRPTCGAVVISGETDPELPRLARACGADAFFSKPFSASAVRKSVISLLEGCDGGG